MAEVKLRAIEKKDLKMLQRWRNSDSVMAYCRQYRPLSITVMEKWFDNLNVDSDYNLTNDLFIMEHNGKDIGVGGFVRIDWRNRKAELSFYVAEIPDKISEVINKALSVLLDYAFKTLNLHKVTFPCYSFNPNIPFYEKAFKVESIAKQEYYWKGQYWNRIILVAYEHI